MIDPARKRIYEEERDLLAEITRLHAESDAVSDEAIKTLEAKRAGIDAKIEAAKASKAAAVGEAERERVAVRLRTLERLRQADGMDEGAPEEPVATIAPARRSPGRPRGPRKPTVADPALTNALDTLLPKDDAERGVAEGIDGALGG